MFSTAWARDSNQRIQSGGETQNNTPKKRGRPRKQVSINVVEPVFECLTGDEEAQKSWEIGKQVGMTSQNEPEVVKALRRSARKARSKDQ